MKNPERTASLRARALLALVCPIAIGVGCGTSPPEPGATTETHQGEIPGSHAPSDLDPLTAQRWIDRVRVGDRLDADGAVPLIGEERWFRPDASIHVSMRVADAPAGTAVKVVVHDAAGNEAWSEERSVVAGEPSLIFTIDGGTLAAGRYEVGVIVGDEKVARRSFDVTTTGVS